jgi:hypothetical protein
MSAEEEKAAKKRKRSSKTHESTKPRKKRSKTDITDGEDSLTNTNAGSLQRADEPDEDENFSQSLVIALQEQENWSISAPVGGRFLDAPPLFSRDERLVCNSILKNPAHCYKVPNPCRPKSHTHLRLCQLSTR